MKYFVANTYAERKSSEQNDLSKGGYLKRSYKSEAPQMKLIIL